LSKNAIQPNIGCNTGCHASSHPNPLTQTLGGQDSFFINKPAKQNKEKGTRKRNAQRDRNSSVKCRFFTTQVYGFTEVVKIEYRSDREL